MTPSPKICVLGSVNLDLIIQTERLPAAGETVTNGQYTSLPGGKGANAALAARKLGAEVELRAAVGVDDYADQALMFLKQEDVDLQHLVQIENSHTGLAFINVSADGENQIAVASGANGVFSAGQVGVISADVLITQFEIPIATIEKTLSSFDGFVCVNASPVLPDVDAIIHRADLVIVNEGEYHAYKDVLEAYEGRIVITLGGNGAKMLQNGHVLASAKPPKVKVVDTTGAGDAFAAAITVALSEGQDNQSALEFACAVGALTTTKLGTQSAAPYRAAVDALLT